MSDFDEKLHKLSLGCQRIYTALWTAAYNGDRCPTNDQLAEIAGRFSARYGSEAVSAIEQAGLIAVLRGHRSRIIILASGQSTEIVKDVPRTRAWRTGAQIIPVPANRPFERTCCHRCGARSDYGCSHMRVAA
jgi:hypothetical protein